MLQITKPLLYVVLLKPQVLLASPLPPFFPSLLFITNLLASHFSECKWFLKPACPDDAAFTSISVNNSILYTWPGADIMCRALCGGMKMNQASSERLRDSPSSRRAGAWIQMSKTQRSHEKGKVLAFFAHCCILGPISVPSAQGLLNQCLWTAFITQGTKRW